MEIESALKTKGEPSIRSLATGLGTLGRYGDSYMVHAAEGETVVPREILEANPKLKGELFSQMRMMGVDDPNRYVIGNSLNSINPVTGQPEFFFKKIWQSIKKVAKAVAPIVVPIIGNMIAPGIGGILASGLYSKATGGSWGDALKSAGTAWLGGSLAQGIGGALGGGGLEGFTSGLSTGLTDPLVAGANLFSKGAANPLSQGILGEAGYTGIAPTYDRTAGEVAQGAPIGAPDVRGIPEVDDLGIPGEIPVGGTSLGVPEDRNILQRGADYLFRGGETPEAISAAQSDAGNKYLADMKLKEIAPTEAGLKAAEAAAGPGMITTFGPSAAIATGIAALIDSGSDEDIPPPEGSERFAAYKDWLDLTNAGGDKNSPEAQALYHQWNQTPGDQGYTREAWARAVGVESSNRPDWHFEKAQPITTDVGVDIRGVREVDDLALPVTTAEIIAGNVPAPVVPIQPVTVPGSDITLPPTLDRFGRSYSPIPETALDYGSSKSRSLAGQLPSGGSYPDERTGLRLAGQFPSGGSYPDERTGLRIEAPTIVDDARNDPRALRRYPGVQPVTVPGSDIMPYAPSSFRGSSPAIPDYPIDPYGREMELARQYRLRNPIAPQGIGTLNPNRLLGAQAMRQRLPVGLAGGGEVYGRGTGTSDSIPARLSDGEFVMTAEAVRNAGGGDRQLGAARMYDMMRRFEGGAT